MAKFSGTVFMWVDSPVGPVPQLVYFDDYDPDQPFKPLFHVKLPPELLGLTLKQLAVIYPYSSPRPPTEPAAAALAA